MASGDASAVAERAIEGAILELHHWSARAAAGRDAKVHFVALDACAARGFFARHLAKRFLPAHRRFDVEQSEAGGDGRQSFDAEGIAHDLAEHLISRAEAEHAPAASHECVQVVIP